MFIKRVSALRGAVLLALLTGQTIAAEPTDAETGKLLFSARWRAESFSDAAIAKDAFANTLRLRLGYQTAVYQGLSGILELEGTTHLFGDDFNSTANGNTQFPVVTDPDNHEVNKAFLSYKPNEHGKFNLGRQAITLDNQRFFGSGGWRQNEQTFDALDLNYIFDNKLSIRYDYINRVQRVNGADNPDKKLARWNLNLNLLHIDYSVGPGKLTAYAYFNENDTLPLTSQKNFGVRYVANKTSPKGTGWLATAEYADQSDYADGASYIDANYILLEGGLVWKGSTFKAGWEQLGGNGRYGFQTPYASLHAFNGWADKFTTTPKNGLQDTYLSWNRKIGKLSAAVVWHDFKSDVGSFDYGQEWDASISWALNKRWTVLGKYAYYQANDYLADTTKLWLSVEYAY